MSDWPKLRNYYLGSPACWIAGSGPSLDEYDLRLCRNAPILACNAAVTYFCRHVDTLRDNLWWVFNNENAFTQSADKLNGWRPRVVALERCRAVVRKDAEAYYYNQPEGFPRHTTAETMLRLADWMGFRAAYLVGIDCGPLEDTYAEELKYTRCIWKDKRQEYYDNWAFGLWNIYQALSIKAYTCSPYFPDGIFRRVTFPDAIERIAECSRTQTKSE